MESYQWTNLPAVALIAFSRPVAWEYAKKKNCCIGWSNMTFSNRVGQVDFFFCSNSLPIFDMYIISIFTWSDVTE